MGRTVIAACAARVMDEPPPPPTDALLLQTYDWQRKAEAEVRKQTNKQTHCGPEALQSSRASAGVFTVRASSAIRAVRLHGMASKSELSRNCRSGCGASTSTGWTRRSATTTTRCAAPPSASVL